MCVFMGCIFVCLCIGVCVYEDVFVFVCYGGVSVCVLWGCICLCV